MTEWKSFVSACACIALALWALPAAARGPVVPLGGADTRRRSAVLIASVLAGCSGADQGSSSRPSRGIGEVTAAQSPPGLVGGVDAGRPGDAGYLNWWIEPDGATGGNNLSETWIKTDGGIGCPAPAALAQSVNCTQVPLLGGSYYTNLDDPSEGMLGLGGEPISQPLDSCAAGEYVVRCDYPDGGNRGIQDYPPPASLGCTGLVPGSIDTGLDYYWCCPCP